MKRPGSCDSLGALMSICPSAVSDETNPIYTREFQTMLEGYDEEGCCVEEAGQKKRRLSVDQVKALEKNFEVENKLEPDRKVKLAQELGLQPRQVAVWFQNRRARWKTKALERDYGILKAKYDGLQHNYDNLQRDNESLMKEIQELKSKLNEDDSTISNQISVKEEPLQSDTEEKDQLEPDFLPNSNESASELNLENLGASVFVDFKDGSSDDSDSSAILNEDSPIAGPHQFLDIHNGSSSSMNISFQFSGSKGGCSASASVYQPQFVKIEEHNFFGEESCSTLFSDDQAPTLQWYCPDDWNC